MELARSSSFSSSKKVLGWYWFSEIFAISASLVASVFVVLISFFVVGVFFTSPNKASSPLFSGFFPAIFKFSYKLARQT